MILGKRLANNNSYDFYTDSLFQHLVESENRVMLHSFDKPEFKLIKKKLI